MFRDGELLEIEIATATSTPRRTHAFAQKKVLTVFIIIHLQALLVSSNCYHEWENQTEFVRLINIKINIREKSHSHCICSTNRKQCKWFRAIFSLYTIFSLYVWLNTFIKYSFDICIAFRFKTKYLHSHNIKTFCWVFVCAKRWNCFVPQANKWCFNTTMKQANLELVELYNKIKMKYVLNGLQNVHKSTRVWMHAHTTPVVIGYA